MKLHIAIPAYQRKIDAGVLTSICSLLCSHPDWEVSLDHVDSSIPSSARNNLVRRFLETDAEWLLFWDNDIAVNTPGAILRMMILSEQLQAIVGAPCKIKGDVHFNCGMMRNNRVELMNHVGSPRLVDVVGTGLMLIPRKVFSMILDPWFEVIEQAGGVVLGEDFNFCLKAREAGINIAVEPRIETIHYGVAGWLHQEVKSIAA